ncbi:hypothetical protein BT96DRAFT_939377 [Gymnopus androsaceus JB14]|uniref:Uncharacterized protein n=1 Tax=Gymnopus androsaceus JB14 TaxID=1447944 RepID=A0A6A4HRD0_9AGAR|nr:hypothetical protein BT96DRAFT_939377 [Gymnopus androsaceus JB14]
MAQAQQGNSLQHEIGNCSIMRHRHAAEQLHVSAAQSSLPSSSRSPTTTLATQSSLHSPTIMATTQMAFSASFSQPTIPVASLSMPEEPEPPYSSQTSLSPSELQPQHFTELHAAAAELHIQKGVKHSTIHQELNTAQEVAKQLKSTVMIMAWNKQGSKALPSNIFVPHIVALTSHQFHLNNVPVLLLHHPSVMPAAAPMATKGLLSDPCSLAACRKGLAEELQVIMIAEGDSIPLRHNPNLKPKSLSLHNPKPKSLSPSNPKPKPHSPHTPKAKCLASKSLSLKQPVKHGHPHTPEIIEISSSPEVLPNPKQVKPVSPCIKVEPEWGPSYKFNPTDVEVISAGSGDKTQLLIWPEQYHAIQVLDFFIAASNPKAHGHSTICSLFQSTFKDAKIIDSKGWPKSTFYHHWDW